MRSLFPTISVAMLLSSSGAGAIASRGGNSTCSAAPSGGSSAGEVAPLLRELAERDAELKRLRASLEDAGFHDIARATGVAEAVRASGLPERHQRRVATAIVREAKRNRVDPLLVVALIRTESSFDNYAVSPVGAMGLMQVMPDTGKWMLQKRGVKLGRRTNLFDSDLNIEIGTAYLAQMIESFGSVEKALVAYNAGPSAARKILANHNARAKFMAGYPKKVLGELRKLKSAAEARLAEQSKPQKLDGRG